MTKIKTLSRYMKRRTRDRLRLHFDLSTDQHIEDGKNWYATAHHKVIMFSGTYVMEPIVVASILSALSPRNKWERNLIDTENVIKAFKNREDPDSVKVCTFNTNKYKAFAIANGKTKIEQTSRKTYSFVQNIANLCEEHVTIDVWMLRAMFGKTVKQGLTPSRYDELVDIILDEASKVGLLGYQYQAIIWECIRERNI